MYVERKRLASLGITCSIDDYPQHILEGFLVIDTEIDKIEREKDKKRAAKSRMKRG